MTTTKVKEQLMSLTITPNGVKKAVKSYIMSKRYINTMLRATIINILYHRLNIDDREFTTKTFNKIPFKTFKNKSRNAFIRDFHTYMTACKDAIEKNYLREFYLYFVDTSSEDIVENYKFSFNYSNKQDEKISQNEENLTESTCELLQTLNDLGRHNKLQANIQLKVEFTYFEDTPQEYEPPGFRGIDESESFIKKLDKNGNSVVIGTLFTGFHTLKCRGRGEIFNFNDSETASNIEVDNTTVPKSPHPIDMTVNRKNSTNLTSDNILTEDLSPAIGVGCGDVSMTNPNSSSRHNNFNDTYISECIDLAQSDSDVSVVDCPCKLPSVLGAWAPDLIRCVICKQKFHAPCQGYIDKTFLSGSYRCLQCRGENDSESLYDHFQGEPSKAMYRIRYILACAYQMSRIPSEMKTIFDQTVNNLHLDGMEGSKMKINMAMLHTIFKLDHKLPDPNKLTFYA